MQTPQRTHDRKSFFKYMPASTAEKVLENCSLRWSSPLIFNDPFDVPRELVFGLEPEHIVRALGQNIRSLIENPPSDTSHLEPKLKLIIDTVKKGISFELRAQLLAGLTDDEENFRPSSASLDAIRQMWRDLLPQLRILCLTESPRHAAMWLHYADRYAGVVLELACSDVYDSAWLVARKVAYPEDLPPVYSAIGWAELLSNQPEYAVQRIFELATYTKSPDWSYENEWRISSKSRSGESGLYSDYRFHPNELVGIYYGPEIATDARYRLNELARKFQSARTFDVSIGMSRHFQFKSTDA